VKSREAKRHTAWQLIAWISGVVVGLLILYTLTEGTSIAGVGIMVPLITVTGTLCGVYLGAHLSQQQRLKDEQRRRRALATLILSEIQVLYEILKDIHQAYHLKALHQVAIEPFHTAMYDQAGSDRLLFQSGTAQMLAQFYSLVYTLRMELNHFRELTPESRMGRDDAVRFRTLYIAELIKEAMHKLSTAPQK
jgi:hypothetical protein